MSHIHLPDGLLALPIWLGAWVLMAFFLAFSIKKVQKKDIRKILPFTGIAAAVMLLGMSVPIFIIPVHLSLAVLTGILLGPSMGIIVAFVVMTILAMFGHGGLTLIGLNTLLMGIEMFLGYHVFHTLKLKNTFVRAFLSVVLALMVSMSLMIATVGYTVGFAEALPHAHEHSDHDHDHDHEADHDHDHDHEADHDHDHEADHDHEHEADHDHEHGFENAVSEVSFFSISGLYALIAILAVGMILEGLATGILINYFSKVRPEILRKRG